MILGHHIHKARRVMAPVSPLPGKAHKANAGREETRGSGGPPTAGLFLGGKWKSTF